MPLGKRHIWVNITDYHAKIVDNGKVTFETRSVVGHRDLDRRTPEFSDVMEHMVINPTWNVPRSIAVKEYLPMMQQNPNAAGHLRLTNSRGQTVSRQGLGLYPVRRKNLSVRPETAAVAPKRAWAGQVHVPQPAQHLSARHAAETVVRSRSARLQPRLHPPERPLRLCLCPVEKAGAQPRGVLSRKSLATGRETVVPLEKEVPVHLVYRTAVTQPKGKIQFRRDVYGRDARIWKALADAGVSLRALRG